MGSGRKLLGLRYFAFGIKINVASIGRSGIGAFVAGLSQSMTLKGHTSILFRGLFAIGGAKKKLGSQIFVFKKYRVVTRNIGYWVAT